MRTDEENLATLAVGPVRIESWSHYDTYCQLRAMGLRSWALKELDAFLRKTDLWPFEERQSFVLWLCERMSAGADLRSGALPYPLFSHLLRPTLMEWSQVEPKNPRPHRWLGMFLRYGSPTEADEILGEISPRRAIALDPDEQPARVRLARDLLSDLEYSVHHLPEIYLGDPVADLAKASEVGRLAGAVRDEQERQALREEVDRYRQLAANWTAFLVDGGQDLERWCVERGLTFKDPYVFFTSFG